LYSIRQKLGVLFCTLLPTDSTSVGSVTAIVLPKHTNMLIGVSFKVGSKYAYRQ